MKFLCIPCDSPMTLQTVGPPDRGSLSVVYSCPECGYEIAMLTNAYETQVVQSLGVRIGPDRLRAEGASAVAEAPADRRSFSGGWSAGRAEPSAEAGGRCPFSAMIPTTEGPGAAERPPTGVAVRPAEASEPVAVRWTAAAEARLEKVPEFVRPMARTGIERFARERGAMEIDEQVLDAAREFFGM
jgi:Proto-chlorophyllide reductase 57 kD subunit